MAHFLVIFLSLRQKCLTVESGVLRARPFSGVAILIKNNLSSRTTAAPSGDISGITNKSLLSYSQTILASDRFAIF